jgi:hypothetical protein
LDIVSPRISEIARANVFCDIFDILFRRLLHKARVDLLLQLLPWAETMTGRKGSVGPSIMSSLTRLTSLCLLEHTGLASTVVDDVPPRA